MRIQFGKDDYIFVEVAEGARWKITNSRDGVFFADGYDGEISISVHMNSSQTEVIVIRNADRDFNEDVVVLAKLNTHCQISSGSISTLSSVMTRCRMSSAQAKS
jgi:hypothetical protein